MDKKFKLLIVDDNEMIRMYLRDIFWVHGLEPRLDITTVDNIEEAFEKASADPAPDLIILDLSLPLKFGERPVTEGGFVLLEKLKEANKLEKIKVIIFSGLTEIRFRQRASDLGAQKYLVKDENLPKDIVDYIESLI